MKRLCMIFMLVLASSISLAQDIAPDVHQWKLTVWVNPPEPNSMFNVWIRSDGSLSMLGKNSVSERIESDRKIERAPLVAIFKAASLATKAFVVQQEEIMTDDEISKVVDSTWSMGIALRVGNQAVSVDDFVMKRLDERPAFKTLLILINKELPKKHKVRLQHPNKAP